MSGKLGSEEGLRDPNTPDTLHDQLMAARRARREMRESQSPVLTTPVDNAAGIAHANGAQQSARGQLDFDQEDADHRLRAPPPHDGQPWEDLFDFDHPTMVTYMEEQGVKDEALELLVQLKIDGQQWRMMVTDAKSTCIKEDIAETIEVMCGKDIPITSKISIQMQTKLAFEKWLEKREANHFAGNEQLLSIKELHSIKLPELPAGKGVDGRVTGEQVKTYAEALNSILNLIDRQYSDRIMEVHKQPTAATLAICLQGMTQKAWQLNELVGAAFMKRSSTVSMSSITALKRHKINGRYCGLSILQALGEATTQLTGARLGDLLLKLFKPINDKPTELHRLEPMYKTHKEALTSLQSLDIELHSVIQCFILQQMASSLAMKPEHNIILGIPMASIIKSGFEDLPGMTAMIESAIIEASNDPKLNRPRVKPDKEKPLEKQIAALNPFSDGKPSQKICVENREEPVSGYKCGNENCRYIHQRNNRVCTAPEYAKYGRCKGYFKDCMDQHPFHEEAKEKYGNPQNAWRELCKEFPEASRSNKRAAPSSFKHSGKAFPVCPVAFTEVQVDQVVVCDTQTQDFESESHPTSMEQDQWQPFTEDLFWKPPRRTIGIIR